MFNYNLHTNTLLFTIIFVTRSQNYFFFKLSVGCPEKRPTQLTMKIKHGKGILFNCIILATFLFLCMLISFLYKSLLEQPHLCLI